MKVLFITSNRIGDAVLSTGILDYLLTRSPAVRLTLVCGPLAAPLFSDIPQLERLIPLAKKRHSAHWLELWRQTAGTHWDLVVDLRHSLFSWLVRTHRRAVFHPTDRPLRRVCQLAAMLKAEPVPSPRLWLSDERRRTAQRLIPGEGPVLAIGPAANWRGKQWPADRFVTLIDRLTCPGGLMASARVAVFGGPQDREEARPVMEPIPPDRLLDFVGTADIGLAGACLERCSLYVGNDSGLMHVAAAAGIPTVGLFGPSREDHYGPWGDRSIAVRTDEDFAFFAARHVFTDPIPRGWLDSITVERVLEAVAGLMK